jgi:Co/Zn/Cd efflux system component
MKDCCELMTDVSVEQRRVLRIVLWINVGMFLVEFGAGLLADSTALLADSVSRGSAWQARAALLKGAVMALFGVGVLVEVVLKIARGTVPAADVMGGIGALALAANLGCLLLLRRRRADDINMRSAWLCSRNDVMANAGVLLAAAGVFLTRSAWPDIAIGLVIAALFATSALGVIREARRVLQRS